MLVEFKVSNYKSFKDVQTLSMKAGKVQKFSDRLYKSKHNKLLKFLSIYGANASGKSNLISALELAQTIILGEIPAYSANCYCRLEEDNKNKPSLFEFTIELNEKVFKYGFEIILNSCSFVSEWLHELVYNNKYKVVFERRIEDGFFIVDKYFKDPAINERLKIYSEDIKRDNSVLFLTLMNQNKDSLYEILEELSIYKNIFEWFRNKLSVNSPDRPVTNYSFLLNNESIKDIGKLLDMFGTGVSHFELIDVSLEKLAQSINKELLNDIDKKLKEYKRILAEKQSNSNPVLMLRDVFDKMVFVIELDNNNQLHAKTLQFNHINTDALFELKEESDGTVRLLDLIEVLLTEERDKVYVIDEINRRLHPLLTYRFVEEYLERAQNKSIQLIASTHETKILDFDLLRKDEICFVNKGYLGDSEVYSMEKFNARFDKRIRSAYLEDKEYEAVPVFHESIKEDQQ